MARIQIRIDQIMNMDAQLSKNKNRLSHTVNELSNIHYGLSYEIRKRRNIDNQIERLTTAIVNVENRVKRLENFVDKSMIAYDTTERKLKEKSLELFEEKRNKKVNQGNIDKNSFSTMSLIDKITAYFDKVNKGISWGDAILLGTQASSALGALFLSKNLEVVYQGGKPTKWDRFRGKYRYTLRADESWLAKSNYSSKIARAIADFMKSSPTNPLLKKLHNVVSSYRTPSSLLKHVMGFPKDVTVSLEGKALYKTSFGRVTNSGSVGVLESAVKVKGLTKLARKIPVVGLAISAIANSNELVSKDNANKSIGEKFGRFAAGMALDAFSIGAGAKLGALAGSLGGPIGAVVGGAIGGTAGAIISIWKEDMVKDTAEKIVNNIGKSINSIGEKFKSIGSWMR